MAKVGDRGGADVTLGGDGVLPGKKRKPPVGEKVAARVKAFVDAPPGGEGVQPLNSGFFLMQRMRGANRGQRKLRDQ